MIVEDRRDRFRQEDVNNYLIDITKLTERAAAEGPETYNAILRELCKTDLYYLGLFVFDIKKMYSETIRTENGEEEVFHPWIFNRCREVEAKPDFCVDIWAREHFKSTIITFLKSVQDILNDPEIAICVYSYNSTIAKKFVRQIREGLENNELKRLFPEIIPEKPSLGKYYIKDKYGHKQEKKFTWSDESFTVKRKTGRKEPTVGGYGLVNSQATGMHFDILVYDDVVTPDSVRTQAQNAYTTEQWSMSLNTGSGESARVRIIGTRYDQRDTYFHILNPMYASTSKMGGSRYTLRCYPCYAPNGEPVLYTKNYLENKRLSMHGFVWSSQMECDPRDSSTFRFMEEWIKERCKQENILKDRDKYNLYIIVDPANTQNKKSDYTSMVVVAAGPDKRFYVVDGIRDKLLVSERVEKLFTLVKKWENSRRKPMVFYEQSGLSTDTVTIRDRMAEMSYHFELHAASVKPRVKADLRMTGVPKKEQRIQALEPFFRRGDVVLAESAMQINFEGREENVIQKFVDDEYLNYPFVDHDDFFDALSRTVDLETGPLITFPEKPQDNYMRRAMRRAGLSDMDIYTLSADSYIPF